MQKTLGGESMKKAYWPPTKPNDIIPISLADGINQEVESIEIKESECSDSVNMDSSFYPTLSVRDGMTLYSTHTGYINRIFKFAGVWYAGDARGLYKLVSGVWTVVYDHGDTNNNRLWNYVIFLDKLYFVNGSIQLQEYDGTTKTAIAAAPNNSDFITTHANRVYLANDADNNLSFSGLRLADDWSSTDKYVGSGQIVVETSDGEKPTAIAEYANHIVELKKHTMHELFGEDSTNFTMRKSFDVGAISQRTVITTERAIYFLGTDGFYEYMGGSFPQNVGKKVKNYIQSINMAYAQHCVAGYDGRFIYLTLVTGASTTPDVTLKYDTETGNWWPESYVATAFFLDGQDFYIANQSGQIIKTGGSDDMGTAISWFRVTKPLSDGSEIQKKTVHKYYVIADIDIGSTVNLYYSPDTEGETWTLVKSVTPTGTLKNYKIPLIISTPSEWHRIKISGTGKAKLHRIYREVNRRGA